MTIQTDFKVAEVAQRLQCTIDNPLEMWSILYIITIRWLDNCRHKATHQALIPHKGFLVKINVRSCISKEFCIADRFVRLVASANAVSEGDTLSLTCYSDVDGQALVFRRDSSPLLQGTRFSVRFLNRTTAVFRISPVVSVDGGVYHCTNSFASSNPVFITVTRGGNCNLIAELIKLLDCSIYFQIV